MLVEPKKFSPAKIRIIIESTNSQPTIFYQPLVAPFYLKNRLIPAKPFTARSADDNDTNSGNPKNYLKIC